MTNIIKPFDKKANMKQSKYERGRYQFSLPHTHIYFQVDRSQFVFYFLPQEILVDYFQVHFQTYFQAFTLKDPSDWKQQAFNLYNFPLEDRLVY